MVEIDVYWFFWASMCTYPLHSIQEGIPLSMASGDLGIAKVGLESFGDDAQRVFPNTAAKTKEIVDCINEMLPPNRLLPLNRVITSWEATTLRNAANALTSTLKDEAKHNYILCVENQRCLSAYSLVEKIEK